MRKHNKRKLKKYHLSYKPFGKSAILIEWPAKIEEAIIEDIVAFDYCIEKGERILDTILAYNSLTIKFNGEIDFEAEVACLKEQYPVEKKTKQQPFKCWQIPVCYNSDFGLDLRDIAQLKKLTIPEVIELHTAPTYLIYFIGFQPGFLYLGGLNDQIHTPRRATPRLRVAKGSVGIGGAQTGVYPQSTSGGWNIIGKSPVNFFDILKPQPCFAKAGDRIQFRAIDRKSYQRIEQEVMKGTYQIKFHVL